MLCDPSKKYPRFIGVQLPDRQWPQQSIEQPPIWMSTDLRDGNQALIDPMSVATKLRMFKELVTIGFKEIEIGFPSASSTDFDFSRLLIEENHIPDDVTIEVLVQARYDLIERTVESVRGARRVILHVYNPLAPAFRKIVYNTDKQGVKTIAMDGARWCKELAEKAPEIDWVFQYSPEVFSSTEVEFVKEVSDEVANIWQPTPEHKMILNLPATVEMSTPNTYADQIEWIHRNINNRDSIIISVHPHNDRGTAVAAAELAVMAGADRVEGCLFGNGERTGNVDLVTLALNLYSQGVHPGLDFSNIEHIRNMVEQCNQLPVHPRHPYAGELVFTAFSGSHQDAIKKGFAAQQNEQAWAVPYLPIDPADLNRNYDEVVRVNSQSGKGGVSFLLQQNGGMQLPRRLQIEFSAIVQSMSEKTGKEVSGSQIVEAFEHEYLARDQPVKYLSCQIQGGGDRLVGGESQKTQVDISVQYRDQVSTLAGEGTGPLDAASQALKQFFDVPINIIDFHEHSLNEGSDSVAMSYVEVKVNHGKPIFGVGRDGNILTSAIGALINAVNRSGVI